MTMIHLDKTTEEYALKCEQEFEQWYIQNEEKEQAYLEQIDKWLLSGSNEERLKFLQFLSDEETISVYKYRSNSMIDVIAIGQIYQEEVRAEETQTILDAKCGVRLPDLQTLKARMRELRFIFWRMEFAKEPDAGAKLLHYIKEYAVSPFFLLKAVDTMTVDKAGMLCELVELLIDEKMLRHVYWMLKELRQLLPEDESVEAMIKGIEEVCGIERNAEI